MSNIERRIEKLEELRANKSEPVWLVVVYDGMKKPSEADFEKAKAEYRKEHPEEKAINVIYVTTEEARETTLSLLDDPLPGK